MTIDKLLLPRERYEEVRKSYGISPFTFEIIKDNQVLFYFGANHSNDPKNLQYPKLREYWNRFLEVTKDKEKIVLVEGSLRRLQTNEEDAIMRSSEGGWVTWAADKVGIPVACPDISVDDYAENDRDFTKEEWLLLSFVLWVESLTRYPEPIPKMREGFDEWRKNQQSKEEFNNMEITLERIENLYKTKIGKEFSENENLNNLLSPNRTDTILNKLARAHSDAREVRIVSEIERYWKEGKSIFVVFGSGHLIIQKPALEKL